MTAKEVLSEFMGQHGSKLESGQTTPDRHTDSFDGTLFTPLPTGPGMMKVRSLSLPATVGALQVHAASDSGPQHPLMPWMLDVACAGGCHGQLPALRKDCQRIGAVCAQYKLRPGKHLLHDAFIMTHGRGDAALPALQCTGIFYLDHLVRYIAPRLAPTLVLDYLQNRHLWVVYTRSLCVRRAPAVPTHSV